MLKAAVWLHRWTGVALSLVFTLWFASGAVLLFVPFPSLDRADAAAHAAAVPLDRLTVGPAQAMAGLPAATSLGLVGLRGEPVYVFGGGARDLVVSGVTGRETPPLTSADARAVASAFGRAPVTRVDGPFDYDQWIVHQGFDHARPFFRARVADGRGTELYVSARTGEVLQRTRAAERAWNWAGAVTHWIYIVPLRRSFAAWDTGVWTLSLVALATTLLGVALGVFRTFQAVRRARRAASPFRGWLQWHHLLGLGTALVVVGWVLSGWLSMDHGRLFSRGTPRPQPAATYAGATLAQASAQWRVADVVRLGRPSRIDFAVVGGGLTAGSTPAPTASTPAGGVRAALAHAWPGSIIQATGAVALDDFWARAEGLGPSADRYDLSAPAPAHVYVDRATGRLLAVVDASRAAYDVLYYGLHTFQWPGLSERPVLRAALVCALLGLGASLCVTSLLVSWRRIRITAGVDQSALNRGHVRADQLP